MKFNFNKNQIIIASSILVIILSYFYGIYNSKVLLGKLEITELEYASTTVAFQEKVASLDKTIAELEENKKELTEILSEEQKKTLELERDRRRKEREIDTLTKLTTLDPELLKKYSKVYFLSENYTPPQLEALSTRFTIDPAKEILILGDIHSFLTKLLSAAEKSNLSLKVLSGYRSFEYQKDLKSDYNFIYGAGTANQFSADQGYSEHQLGTTIDFTTPTIRGADISFENTPEFKWLTENAYKYGFVLSYPKGNQYYVYEPWHWRFVGEELADDLHDDGKYFYELDQRDIDGYLLEIFD